MCLNSLLFIFSYDFCCSILSVRSVRSHSTAIDIMSVKGCRTARLTITRYCMKYNASVLIITGNFQKDP